MTTDLFEELPQAAESARTGGDSFTPKTPAGPTEDRTSIDYFAKLQAGYKADAERSAKAFREAREKSRAAAQEGIDRAVDHAERDVPVWSEVAFAFVKLYATQHRGEKFTGYEIVRASKARVTAPPTDKAWGGPLQRAARAGIIRKVGGVPDPNPERHGSMVPLWEAA